MNKLRTARLLMAVTIILVIVFQVYWINKLYREEEASFKKSADIIFRDAMYRLQAERFTGDTLVFKGMPGDNLFMNDVVSSIGKRRTKDSTHQKLVISMNTDLPVQPGERDTQIRKIKKDTVVYIDAGNGKARPAYIEKFLSQNQLLNDSIPIQRIDSLYSALLAKEGIHVSYHIVKNALPSIDSASMSFSITTDTSTKFFATRRVPVGFISPVFYKAEFEDATMHLLKKISLQLLLSLLLIALTTISFIFIYRSLLAQKRLTDIKNEFIGNITHELKTPIATVSVAIEALNNFDALQNPQRTKEYLGIAGQELNRLSLLVDKVLRLSMFETEQVELKSEWFDMKVLLEEVSNSMQLQMQKFGATVNLQATGIDFMIMADRMHITSVVYNLLDNALKYSKGSPVINIKLDARETEMILTIQDNGIGIPASYKDKVFDKFFRVPHGNKHNVKGYGLGLSYTAHIIAQHNGTINVESDEDKGTTFIIKLPK